MHPKDTMRRDILLFIFVAMILGSVLVHVSWKKVAEHLQYLTARVTQLEESAAERKPTEKVVETVVSKCQPWGMLQSQVRDTVVQVFVQIAEFNWLQPYKTPRQQEASGSGFFISEDGEFITNAHVVNQAYAIGIQIPSLGKQMFDAQVIGVSQERDVALVKLCDEARDYIKTALGSIPYLELGDSDVVRRADEIMALGYPLGQQTLKSTTGVISGKEHDKIQMDAAINPGSSGGPVLNVDGKVVGISCSGIVSAQNVGYIIPINELKLVLDDLHKIRLLRKPFLGVFSNPASEALTQFLGNPAPGGCYVVGSYKGSPLHRAGVQAGDMIYKMNGHKVDMYGEMQVPWSEDRISILDYVSRLEVGEKITLVVYRKGQRKELVTTFDHAQLPPIRVMYPGYEEIDYEVFGGLVFMQLARNHLPLLVGSMPALIKYEEIKNQLEPVLLVTHVLPGSQAQRSRALVAGMVLKEANGQPVKTLAELREAIRASLKTGFLTIKTTDDVVAAMDLKAIIADEHRLSRDYRYPLTALSREMIQAVMGGQVSTQIKAK